MGWWYKFSVTAMRLGLRAACRTRTYGKRNVPRTGGVILASNHQSYLDPVFVAAALDRELQFMARASLFRNPAFRALIVSYKTFAVDRDTGDVKGVKVAIERLRAGAALLVFPEGTRTRDGNVAQMKSGTWLLARRAAVPIVPVLIEGAYHVWPRTRVFPRRGFVNVLFGPPLYPGDDRRNQTGERIRRGVVALSQLLHRKVNRHDE